MTFSSAAILLFLVMDPLGNVPLFVSALSRVAPARRTRVLVRELVIALVALLAFLFFGRSVVGLLGIREESISIAGGIVLFLISLRMLFPPPGGAGEADAGEPFVVPLAIPLVAGPSALATLLLLAGQEGARPGLLAAALGAAWLASSLILLASPLLHRALGERGLVAFERLAGLLLVALAVQMFLDGLAVHLR
ncbi:MAG: YhgN family transporter [Acidobacteria bacterium]|jgi:multiple antibiotic resistance protein|nr:YhgN family transporter [Acidobacteriota bacterium]